MVRSDYVLRSAFANEFRKTGLQLLDHAEQEYEKGDLLQASEKSWGAASQFLKALAVERDWGHETHSHQRQVAQKLAKERDNSEIADLFNYAEVLHSNFYEAHMDAETVRRNMDRVRQYVELLDSLPPPKRRPRQTHVKLRPFYRNHKPRTRRRL